ncbi:MAG: adenylate cyclase [Actinomycetota bacterium]|jgi:class 3 adenylate cyclase|nr:adenylate cyclase [Actinomycetota bacterium]
MTEPLHPTLEQAAQQIGATEGAAAILDREARLVWVSDEFREMLIEEVGEEAVGLGKHIVANYMSESWSRMMSEESKLDVVHEYFPYVMFDTPGRKEGLKRIFMTEAMALAERGEAFPAWAGELQGETFEEIVDSLFEDLEPKEPPLIWTSTFEFIQGDLPPMRINEFHFRLLDPTEGFVGTLILYDPALPARVHGLLARGDQGMYSRMYRLVRPGRRQAAILFADLQSSAQLSRRLPSAAYFRLIRELTTAIDDVVSDNHGIVGKHAGDGVTAFFLAEDLGSPSAASRAAIGTAREIVNLAKRVAGELADDIGIVQEELCRINVGVHWGGRLYMGQLVTGGRLEVTALGDAVNECARIQETARDGDILASKSVIEHLTDEDAAAVGVAPDRMLYQTVAELDAPEKAKRDAGGIPVTSIRHL